MSQFETLPETVRSKLKTDPQYISGNELLPAEVAETMYEQERPLWTASQMQVALDTERGKETVRNKLKKLDEIDICKSMQVNNGRIYWWHDERSDWPIPPDVVVEGKQSLTITELLSPWYAKLGLAGLLLPALAGLVLLVGVFAVDGTISTPISGTKLLSYGLIMIFFSYMLLTYAVLLGIIQWATGDAVDLNTFRN